MCVAEKEKVFVSAAATVCVCACVCVCTCTRKCACNGLCCYNTVIFDGSRIIFGGGTFVEPTGSHRLHSAAGGAVKEQPEEEEVQ